MEFYMGDFSKYLIFLLYHIYAKLKFEQSSNWKQVNERSLMIYVYQGLSCKF